MSAGGGCSRDVTASTPRRPYLGMQMYGGSEASEGGAVKRPLVGAWLEPYSRRADVTASCEMSRTESTSLPIGGAW